MPRCGCLRLLLPRKIRVGVRKAVCTDPAQAKRSAQKVLAEEFTTVVFSHGKPLREGRSAFGKWSPPAAALSPGPSSTGAGAAASEIA